MIWKITSLGDTALLLPVSCLVFVALLAQRQGGAALSWAAAMAACALLTLGAKLGFHLCGAGLDALEIRSPSGHTSVSTAVYGSLGILIGSGRPAWQKWTAAFVAVTLALAVGASRLLLRVHTLEEVLIGYGVGGACVALFAMLFARAGWPRIRLRWMALGVAAAIAILGGLHVGFEANIARLSGLIADTFGVCR